MTYLEFFDEVAIENVCACLSRPPSKVIMLGDDSKKMNIHKAAYQSVLKKRGYDVEFVIKSINRNDLYCICDALCEIICNEDDLEIGLTGGDDLFLVAIGMLYEKYGRKFKIHRFNLENRTLCDFTDGKKCIYCELPILTVRENIAIYGGEVIETDGLTPTDISFIDPDFKVVCKKAWNACRYNTRTWNKQIGLLGELYESRAEAEGLTASCKRDIFAEVLEKEGKSISFSYPLINKLKNIGLITDFSDSDVVSVTFSSELARRLLTVAGLALELHVFLNCASITQGNTLKYDDILSGVSIDWDGRDAFVPNKPETVNEVDVILMEGAVPTFISCKNGYFDANELYKLSSVAERFGSKYSKKLLVASEPSKDTNAYKTICERAADMGITLIDGVSDMSDYDLTRKIISA